MSGSAQSSSWWPHWSEMFDGAAAGGASSDIWRWWEARRLRYNLLVGIVGFVTWWLVLTAGSAAVKPGVDFEEPFTMFLGPFAYALLANICYTLGPIANLIFGDRRRPNKRLFKVGLIFSLVLTALPGIWAVYCWAHSVIAGQKMD